jgi:hypothetical protein
LNCAKTYLATGLLRGLGVVPSKEILVVPTLQSVLIIKRDYFGTENNLTVVVNEDMYQAYIKIQPNNLGDFQFGLVTGSLDGYIEKIGDKERFSFTWEGYY